MQQEAALYFNAYRRDSCDEVNDFCQQRGITLVLNFNGDRMHDDNPDNVIRSIANPWSSYDKSHRYYATTSCRVRSHSRRLPTGIWASGFPQR